MVSRFYARSAVARRAGNNTVFSGLPNYVEPGQPVSEEDQQIVERAIAAAKRRNPPMEESIFNFLREVLLLVPPRTSMLPVAPRMRNLF